MLPLVKTRSVAVSLLPNTGLGNKLYLWARGLVYSEIHRLDFACFGWTKLKIGPMLRGERSSRLYFSEIRKERLATTLRMLALRATVNPVYDPPMSTPPPSAEGSLCVFRDFRANTEPSDSFRDFIEHRAIVSDALLQRLTPPTLKSLESSASPVIGIHIRRGDFRRFDWCAPIESYALRLQNVRDIAGQDLPAVVFSDGTDVELEPVLSMPHVVRGAPNADIVDLLLLSRSRILITSRASTFSNWAAFLSNGVVLRDPKYGHEASRPKSVNDSHYEGVVPDRAVDWPDFAKECIMRIASTRRWMSPGNVS